MGKLGYQNSEIPEPINIKFDTNDYVGGVIPHAKNQSDRRTGGIPANRLNITLAWSLVFGRPFVKRFAYAIGPSSCLSCPVCTVCNVGVLWPNGWTDQDETWHAGRPRPWPHCIRWGLSSPFPKRGPPQFLAHVHYGQTAGWIKVALGKEVGLGPGYIVLDWEAAPSSKRGRSPLPIFRPISIVAKRLDASR